MVSVRRLVRFRRVGDQTASREGTLALEFPDQRESFVVTESQEPTLTIWHCTTRESGWSGTDIRFELLPRDGITIVRFDHLGWPDVGDLFRDCGTTWAHFMESLRLLVETGLGTPDRLAYPTNPGSA